jgi:hypothetical protein
VNENDVTAAVRIKAISVWAAQRGMDITVRNSDARARPGMQSPERRIAESDVGQEQISAAPQLKQMTTGEIQDLTSA